MTFGSHAKKTITQSDDRSEREKGKEWDNGLDPGMQRQGQAEGGLVFWGGGDGPQKLSSSTFRHSSGSPPELWCCGRPSANHAPRTARCLTLCPPSTVGRCAARDAKIGRSQEVRSVLENRDTQTCLGSLLVNIHYFSISWRQGQAQAARLDRIPARSRKPNTLDKKYIPH